MYSVTITVLSHFRDIISVRRCTVKQAVETPAQCMLYVRKFFITPSCDSFFGDFQTSSPLSTYSVEMESTCWDVRPDACENGFMSTIKDCLQFAAFGKRHNLCWNEQTCPGAQRNPADKFLHNWRGRASWSSRFGAPWKLSSSSTGLKGTARESFTLGNSWCLYLARTWYYFIYIYI